MSSTQSMDVNTDAVLSIATLFEHTLSPNPAIQKPAEKQLMEYKNFNGFIPNLVQVMTYPSLSPSVHLAAAIYFKNYILNHWVLDVDETDIISPQDRNVIKMNLISFMLSTKDKVKAQVTNALAIVAKADFPTKWPNLIDDLFSHVANDISSVVSVLEILHYVFFHWRSSDPSLYFDIAKVLHAQYVPKFVELFHSCLTRLSTAMNDPSTVAAAGSDASLNNLLNGIHYFFELMISITAHDVSDYIVNNLAEIVNPAIQLLAMPPSSPSLPLVYPATNPQPVDTMQVSIIDFLAHFVKKYSEEFVPVVEGALNAVWTILRSRDGSERFAGIHVAGLAFLSALIKAGNFGAFFTPQVVGEVCESIIHQMRFTQDDMEDFITNPEEFVSRYLLDSDAETRKRAASDLISALVAKHNEAASTKLLEAVNRQLAEYSASPEANWIAKESALSIVIALCRQVNPVSVEGFSMVPNPAFDIGVFFTTHVIPELTGADVTRMRYEGHAVLKAGCLRFLYMFAPIFPQQMLSQIVTATMTFLNADDYPVHSVAALVIDRILALCQRLTDPITGTAIEEIGKEAVSVHNKGAFVYPTEVLCGQAPDLLRDLFNILVSKEDSHQNEHIAKVILRVVVRSTPALRPISDVLVTMVTARIAVILTQPGRPLYIHSMFEVLACMISLLTIPDSKASEADREICQTIAKQFEYSVAPLLFNVVTTEPAARPYFQDELLPYVYQILALLLKCLPTISPSFVTIFAQLLAHERYGTDSHIQPLIQLVTAYINKGYLVDLPDEILNSVLGIFQYLISVPLTDAHGFTLLRSFSKCITNDRLQKVLPMILKVLFTRLRAKKTVKFNAMLGVYFAELCLNNQCGPELLFNSIGQIQLNFAHVILSRVWPPCGEDISLPVHKQIFITGMTKMLQYVMSKSIELETWSPMLNIVSRMALVYDIPGNVSILTNESFIHAQRKKIEMIKIAAPEQKQNEKITMTLKVAQGTTTTLIFAAEQEELSDTNTLVLIRETLGNFRDALAFVRSTTTDQQFINALNKVFG